MNSFVRLTVGCKGLLSLCLSLLSGLPCSAPAPTVESVSPPNDVCSAQLISLCPHLQRGRERVREREREVKKMEQFVTYSCKNMRGTVHKRQNYKGSSLTDLLGRVNERTARRPMSSCERQEKRLV